MLLGCHVRWAALALLPTLAVAFDAGMFRTACHQSPFCRALRPTLAVPPPTFEVVAGSMTLSETGVFSAQLFSAVGNSSATLLLRAAADDIAAPAWRMQILQRSASNAFAISRLVLPATAAAPVRQLDAASQPAGAHVVRAESGDGQWWSDVEIRESPFRLRLFVGRAGASARQMLMAPSVVFNGGGLLRFASADASLGSAVRASCAPGVSRGGTDRQPDGCTAIAADVTFPTALEAYGLPERAAPLVLQPTVTPATPPPPTVDASVDAATATAAATAAASSSATAALRFSPLAATDGSSRETYRLFNLDVFKCAPKPSGPSGPNPPGHLAQTLRAIWPKPSGPSGPNPPGHLAQTLLTIWTLPDGAPR